MKKKCHDSEGWKLKICRYKWRIKILIHVGVVPFQKKMFKPIWSVYHKPLFCSIFDFIILYTVLPNIQAVTPWQRAQWWLRGTSVPVTMEMSSLWHVAQDVFEYILLALWKYAYSIMCKWLGKCRACSPVMWVKIAKTPKMFLDVFGDLQSQR